MMNRVDVYGKDRNEPYIEITLNNGKYGVATAEELLNMQKDIAKSAFEDGDLQMAQQAIEFSIKLSDALKELKGEKD